MDLSKFLLTTDANNQKKFADTEVTITTSTSVPVDYTVNNSVGAIPDVRVWVKPTLMGDWKMLTDLQLNDAANPSEQARGQVSATSNTVTVSLRPTSPSSLNIFTKIRIYYND